ncbi:MAG: AsmA family protein, partial [Candidatus Acidiferrales bacterium]
MTAQPTKRRRRWLRWLKWPALAFLALALVFVFLVWIGAVDRWARTQIVQQVERITGGSVELKSFTFHWWSLRAEMEGFVVHGREPQGTPPLFAADKLLVDVRVDSLFRRRFSLDEVRIERPQVHVRVDESGANVPAPRTRQPAEPQGKPIRERIFEMVIRSLRIENGALIYNHTQIPLVAQGGEFRLAMDYHAELTGDRYYSGDFAWRQMELAARKYLPFPSNLALKFTLRPENLTLDQIHWTAFNSEVTARATLASFTAPAWTFAYNGRLDLANLRDIFRKPRAPLGHVRFSGEGSWAQGELDVRGSYEASDINVNYDWFTASGLWSRSSYRGNRRQLEFPDFQARTLGGTVTGKISLAFQGLKFRSDVRLQGMNLAAMLEAVDHRGFPTNALHWDGVVEGNVVATWLRDLKSLAA